MTSATAATAKEMPTGLDEITVPYPPELKPFIARAPLQVLVRSCLEWLMDDQTMQCLFEKCAKAQYTRKLTLDFMMHTMLDVICGKHATAGAALAAHEEPMSVTKQAFYGKLSRMEPGVSEAVVAHIGALAQAVIARLGVDNEPIAGYRTCVVDGTYLGGRGEHRIAPLRKVGSAGLTGMALAVFGLGSRTVSQVVLQEDAYTQERALFDRLKISPDELWIADRNFCVRSFLLRIHQAKARFLVRWHRSSCPYTAVEDVHDAPDSAHGVQEQRVWLDDPCSGKRLLARRIELTLPTPTRNGDSKLVLMTDMPEYIHADTLCKLYRERWKIENHYQRLTQQLHCEPVGLNHPRAALFAFAMAVVAGNALAIVQTALQARHGREAVEELSYYYVVLFVASVWEGMSIAVDEPKWEFVQRFTPDELAQWLLSIATRVPMARLRRQRRGPKKPQPPRQSGKHHHHVSIKRLLDAKN